MSKRKIERYLKTVTYTVVVCARRRSIFSAVSQARMSAPKMPKPFASCRKRNMYIGPKSGSMYGF